MTNTQTWVLVQRGDFQALEAMVAADELLLCTHAAFGPRGEELQAASGALIELTLQVLVGVERASRVCARMARGDDLLEAVVAEGVVIAGNGLL